MITSITERPEKWIWTGPGGLPRNGINLWLSSENDQLFMATRNQIQGLKDSSLEVLMASTGMTENTKRGETG